MAIFRMFHKYFCKIIELLRSGNYYLDERKFCDFCNYLMDKLGHDLKFSLIHLEAVSWPKNNQFE